MVARARGPVCNLATSWIPNLATSGTTDLRASYVLSQHFVDTRSHDIADTMSHDIVDALDLLIGDSQAMTNLPSPRLRGDIINYDPTPPGALSVTEFCRFVKVSRSVFYKIRARSKHESTAALHPPLTSTETTLSPIRSRRRQRARAHP